MALHERLLSLNGRLDLALSQIELRSAKSPTHLGAGQGKLGKEKDSNVTRYIEGDSSDDEDMEPEIEKGSEDGSVEEIGLGGDTDDESLGDEHSEIAESGDEDSDEDENGSGDEDEDEDEDDDSEVSDDEPRVNGLIDDEAEESWGSEDDEDEEEG